METNIADILIERGSRYGEFKRHAQITIAIKHIIDSYGQQLSDDQREALHMVAHKMGRILNGDPNYVDSWVDVAGYAKLVADRLEKEAKEKHAVETRVGDVVGRDTIYTFGTRPVNTSTRPIHGIVDTYDAHQ